MGEEGKQAMETLSAQVVEIVERGMAGEGLPDEDVRLLYGLSPNSRDASLVRWAGRELSLQSADGKAEVHAQIGLNSAPCGKNCQFCSFAVCNKVRSGTFEMPVEDVIEYAKIYEEEGANLILMMVTASYRFDKLLERGVAVREVISPEMPLLANTGDMSLEDARRLKEAGFSGCYHAVRMGEGVVTGIPVETRLQTIANIHAAGLSLSTCVEPVGPEHTVDELVEKTRLCIGSGAQSAGVGRRIPVPGTKLYDLGQTSSWRASLLVAAYRLASGLSPRLNCAGGLELASAFGANLAWAEVGTNPRDTRERTEKGGEGYNIAHCRKVFKDAGWELLEGPSPGWILN
jgi:biotin synthase